MSLTTKATGGGGVLLWNQPRRFSRGPDTLSSG